MGDGMRTNDLPSIDIVGARHALPLHEISWWRGYVVRGIRSIIFQHIPSNRNAAGSIAASGVYFLVKFNRLRCHFPPVLADVAEEKVNAPIFFQIPQFVDPHLLAFGRKLLVRVCDLVRRSDL